MAQRAIAGVVQDPDAKAVVGAVVMSRNEQTGEMQTTTTDGRGHFTLAVQPGTYTLEVVVPGFEIVRRNGVQTTSTGNAEEITVKLSIANISESVTVSVALPAAAVAAPVARIADGKVRAVAHQQRIHSQLHIAGVRLQPGAADGARNIQRQRQRSWAERHENVLPRLQGRLLRDELRRDPVQ